MKRMKRALATAITLALSLLAGVASARAPEGSLAPPFPAKADWIGPELSWEGLRGRVVLLDIWTFG